MWAYVRIPHSRATSIIVAKDVIINLAKSAHIQVHKGRFLIGESDAPTKQRTRKTEITLADNTQLTLHGDVILYEGVGVWQNVAYHFASDELYLVCALA